MINVAMQEATRIHQEEMMKLRKSISVDKQKETSSAAETTSNPSLDEENKALQHIVDSLRDENSQLREQVEKLTSDKENHVETVAEKEPIDALNRDIDVYGKLYGKMKNRPMWRGGGNLINYYM